MTKNKNVKIALPIILIVLIITCILVAILKPDNTTPGNNDTPENYNDMNEQNFEENTETPNEMIGSILATGEAKAYRFCNGYGVVRYSDTTYIINTNGEIISSFDNTAEWGDILYDSENWNFYDGTAIFISKHGTLSFPIEYEGVVNNYWYKSEESEVLGVTEENWLFIRETVQTPEGTAVKLGVQDPFTSWIIEPEEVNISASAFQKDDRITYLGNNEFLISDRSGMYTYYYSFNVGTGILEYIGKIYKTKTYYKDDFKYKDQIEFVFPLTENIQVLIIRNNNGTEFVAAIDKNGNLLFEPMQKTAGMWYDLYYSEGLLAFPIKENNTEYIIYVDKNGVESARILLTRNNNRQGVCNSGIISDDNHYYDKTGTLLFE